MIKLTLDPELRERLNGLNEPIELCDETGETVGHFLPDEAFRRMATQLALQHFESPESREIQREASEDYLAGRHITTPELIEYLTKLKAPEDLGA